MTFRFSRLGATAGALGLSLLCLSQAASAAAVEAAPVLFGFVGVTDADGAFIDDKAQSVVGPVSLSIGDAASAAASTEVSYGSLAYQTHKASFDGGAAWAGGLWADGITFSGGTGSTTVDVSTLIGVASQDDMGYTVYLSRTPFTAAQFKALATSSELNPGMPGATTLLSYTLSDGLAMGPMTQQASFSVDFGETIYIAAYLSALGRQADSSGQLTFLMDPAPGVTYQSLSGTTYAVTAVPEPASVNLLVAGWLAAGVAAARRRGQSAKS